MGDFDVVPRDGMLAFEHLIDFTPQAWAADVFEKQWAYIPRKDGLLEKFRLPIDSSNELMTLLNTSYATSSMDSVDTVGGSPSVCQTLDEPSYGSDLNVLKVNSSDFWVTDYHLQREDIPLGVEITAKLEEGFSMQFNFIQCRHAAVAQMAAQLSDFTGGLSVNVNAYMTPSGSCKAFPPHYDPWDVFILQLQGTKKWSLFQSFITLPHPHQVAKLKHLTTMDTPWKGRHPKKIHELVMRPGDLLYIPRGVIHAAESASDDGGEPSLHLSFGANIQVSSKLLLTWETVLHYSVQEVTTTSRINDNDRNDDGDSSLLRCPLPPDSIFTSAIKSAFRNAMDTPKKNEDERSAAVPTWGSLLHLLIYAVGCREGEVEDEYILRRAFSPEVGFRVLTPLSQERGANMGADLTELVGLLQTFQDAVRSVLHVVSGSDDSENIRDQLWGAAQQAETHPQRRAYNGERNFFFDRWMTGSASFSRIPQDPFECLLPAYHFDKTTSPLVILQAMASYWASHANLAVALRPFRDEYQAEKKKMESWTDKHLEIHKARQEEFNNGFGVEGFQMSNMVCTT